MSWIKRNCTPLLMVIVSCFVGVALIEVTLRIVNLNNQWTKTREANILRNFKFNYDVSQLYQSDATHADYARNQYGLRDDCESPSEIDILTIGGSTTAQRYTPFTSTYQERLEQRLKDFNDSFGCVSNAGLDGHTTWGHLFSFEHWFPLIPGLKPKIILLYVGINDAGFQRTSSPNTGFDTQRTDGVKGFLKRLEITNALLPIYRILMQVSGYESFAFSRHTPRPYQEVDYTISKMNPKTEQLSTLNAEAFRSRMKQLLGEIRVLNSKPICVTQPHRFVIKNGDQTYGIPNVMGDGFSGIDYDYSIRKLNNVIYDLCGTNTIDLYNHQFFDSHFYDGIHTTPSGSIEIGDRLADFIISRFY